MTTRESRLVSKTDVAVLGLVAAELTALVVHPEPITVAIVITVSGTTTIAAQLHEWASD